MRESSVVHFIVNGLSVVAFILILKLGASYLPDDGPLSAAKRVLAGI